MTAQILSAKARLERMSAAKIREFFRDQRARVVCEEAEERRRAEVVAEPGVLTSWPAVASGRPSAAAACVYAIANGVAARVEQMRAEEWERAEERRRA